MLFLCPGLLALVSLWIERLREEISYRQLQVSIIGSSTRKSKPSLCLTKQKTFDDLLELSTCFWWSLTSLEFPMTFLVDSLLFSFLSRQKFRRQHSTTLEPNKWHFPPPEEQMENSWIGPWIHPWNECLPCPMWETDKPKRLSGAACRNGEGPTGLRSLIGRPKSRHIKIFRCQWSFGKLMLSCSVVAAALLAVSLWVATAQSSLMTSWFVKAYP